MDVSNIRKILMILAAFDVTLLVVTILFMKTAVNATSKDMTMNTGLDMTISSEVQTEQPSDSEEDQSDKASAKLAESGLDSSEGSASGEIIVNKPQETVKDDYIETYNERKESLFLNKIRGSVFTASDNLKFIFGIDGVFEGFYDGSNPNAVGCSYDVRTDDNSISRLYIYNQDKSGMVAYRLGTSRDGNITLTYESAGIVLELIPIE